MGRKEDRLQKRDVKVPERCHVTVWGSSTDSSMFLKILKSRLEW